VGLVIGVELNKNNEIYLDDIKVVVNNLVDNATSRITVYEGEQKNSMLINTCKMKYVTSNCKMMLSNPNLESRNGFCRISIDAPKSVRILRGELYNKEHGIKSKGKNAIQ